MESNFVYTVEKASPRDLPLVCSLFEQAIAFQKSHQYSGWNNYDENYIRLDIEKGLLYKIIMQGEVICIFSICLADPLIWREKEKGDAIYLHRIILNRVFTGVKAFAKVFDWALNYARNSGWKFIRMDTWSNNSKIIEYYKGYGFRVIENFKTANTPALPVQHRNLDVTLLEYPL